MRSHNNQLTFFVAVVWLLSLATGWAQADVRALARLWQQHVRAPGEHAAIVQSAQQMTSQFPDSSLLPVAQGLGAWHALASGKTNSAILLLAPLLAERSDALGMEARTMAQRWLTRVDREQVCVALKDYYRNHVEFPVSLDVFNKLATTNRPPLLDRFGRAWKYELTSLKRLAGVRAQNYRLQSHALGEDSDLAAAVRRPYGGGLVLWKPMRFVAPPTPGAAASVLFEKNNAKVMLAEGTQQAGTTLVFSREEMIIITDGDYWQLFVR